MPMQLATFHSHKNAFDLLHRSKKNRACYTNQWANHLNVLRSKTVLSGEVFKENFTDILHTNLEQVAFSLPSQKIKGLSYRLNVQSSYKAKLDFQFALFLSWARKREKGILIQRTSWLPLSKFDSSFHSSALLSVARSFQFPQITNLLTRYSYTNFLSNYYFSIRVSQVIPTFFPVQSLSKALFVYLSGVVPTFSYKKVSEKKLESESQLSVARSAALRAKAKRNLHAFTPSRQRRVPCGVWRMGTTTRIRKVRSEYGALCKQSFTTMTNEKVNKYQKVRKVTEKNRQNQNVLLSVKIGDYLSSGDKIGEFKSCKNFCKRKASFFYKGQICNNKIATNSVLFKTLCNASSKLSRFCSIRQKSSTDILKEKSCMKDIRQVKSVSEKTKLSNFSLSGKRGEAIERRKRGVRTKRSAFIPIYFQKKVNREKKAVVLGSSGRVVTISKTQLILQRTQPVLFYNSANLHVREGEWVKEGSPILTLTHQTLITGDIVQGIPRIEQLFEAFTAPPAYKDRPLSLQPGRSGTKKKISGRTITELKNVHDTLHSQVRDIFRKHWLNSVLPIAVRKSLEEISYILVENIQKVYLSQGVLIADKHIEIIIRQIASKGQILDSGSTGLFLEEVLPIRQIENANLSTPGKKCLYVPAVVGLTAAALSSDSFISAASFQETTRVLSRDAIVGKSDFLRGLKEKVVIGDLISAGTGLDIYFIYTSMHKK